MAILDSDSVQVEAIDNNTITIGSTTFIRFTASNKNVEDSTGNQLLLDGDNMIVYYVENGTPLSTNISITNVE